MHRETIKQGTMTVEERELFVKSMCDGLRYDLKVEVETHWSKKYIGTLKGIKSGPMLDIPQFEVECEGNISNVAIAYMKPYLRPMDSMTEDELAEFVWLDNKVAEMPTFEYVAIGNYRIFDWLNRKHFDYRGLIEKGLAIEATSDMYKED